MTKINWEKWVFFLTIIIIVCGGLVTYGQQKQQLVMNRIEIEEIKKDTVELRKELQKKIDEVKEGTINNGTKLAEIMGKLDLLLKTFEK